MRARTRVGARARDGQTKPPARAGGSLELGAWSLERGLDDLGEALVLAGRAVRGLDLPGRKHHVPVREGHRLAPGAVRRRLLRDPAGPLRQTEQPVGGNTQTSA